MVSTIAEELLGIISSISSPTLEKLRLQLDVTNLVTDYFGASNASSFVNAITSEATPHGFDAALAAPVFDGLRRATIILQVCDEKQRCRPEMAKKLAETLLRRLRLLFAPWVNRGIADLLCNTPSGLFGITENGAVVRP